jgi:hypothetical protein
MNPDSTAYYEELYRTWMATEAPLAHRYRRLREGLEHIIRGDMVNLSLQATDLAARINYIATRFGLTAREQYDLHTFRLTSNAVMNHRREATESEFRRDVRAIAMAYRKILRAELPPALQQVVDSIPYDAPAAETPATPPQKMRRLRVCYDHHDDQYLYVRLTDVADRDLRRVRYNLLNTNEAFNDTVDALWRFAQLNLLEVSVDGEGILVPGFIVLEPDYLLDISALAECVADYGAHPLNYVLRRLEPPKNARPLLLGDLANLFLDEWIYAGDEAPDYLATMRKAFRQYPLELAACPELTDPTQERAFFADCKMHFDHIRQTVTELFPQKGYDFDPSDAILEPSYLCEALGIQGRLDYMQRDMRQFIEMKSGKADEYSRPGMIEPKANNRTQMLLYMALLEFSMGRDHRTTKPYLLYTRYPLLYPASASWATVKRIINLRNLIVANEYRVQHDPTTGATEQLIADLRPDVLNERHLSGTLWQRFLRPQIERVGNRLAQLTPLERTYFHTLYRFITKELYTSKSGDVDSESRTGMAALWLSTLDEKREAGEIFYGLRILENRAADPHQPYLVLSVQPDEDYLPNFRQGDAIVLYARPTEQTNVTNALIFKGNIETITATELRIRLRASQRNRSVLPAEALYAVEHDVMDTTFRGMYQGLSAFLDANAERRALLLGQRPPRFDTRLDAAIQAVGDDDHARMALKADAAQDYFLLVGPPGTGKTSRSLRGMVERMHARPGCNLLLMAYTNRAVDEICQAVGRIEPAVDYIRIGSELSCDPRFRPHLIEHALEDCATRQAVRQRIEQCRIFVGTVASLSGKTELFTLKHFDATLIDEATQILEPQLLGLLCQRNPDGRDAIAKFILIGDHKQLPAVVQQNAVQTEVACDALRAIGLTNLKDSLFERLHRGLQLAGDEALMHRATDMLRRQGRMHPGVASFPNRAFYFGRLEPLGLAHQLESIATPVLFVPSQPDAASVTGKTNQSEARLVAQYAVRTYREYGSAFDPDHTLGIITPYRSQIALIRKALAATGIEALTRVSVDTVERYQGSERDVILYSFCVNRPFQLRFLPNLTEEQGVVIDRKLNVALTRARKRMVLFGVPHILRQNEIYRALIDSVEHCEPKTPSDEIH